MTPNSLTFVMFCLAIYIAYRCFSRHRQNILLLTASYYFYATWNYRFVYLIILTTIVNYCAGIMIDKGRMARQERLTASTWLVLASFIYFTARYKSPYLFQMNIDSRVDWNAISSWGIEWSALIAVLVFLALAHFLFSPLVCLAVEKRRKLILGLCIAFNLFILGVFKYYNFFLDNVEWLLKVVSVDPSRFYLSIALPVGISFYTFKAIGYAIDVYRRNIGAEHRYVHVALFIAFFPSLLAGPIERAGNLLPQLNRERQFSWDQLIRGLHLFFYGFFKKTVIADSVARTVSSVYGTTGHVSWIDVVTATVLFTIQIYCDFSGYTDMARGIGKVFGIELPVNFNLPYFSSNPREFWSRWHISLSTWLKDYLYIPLGGNRKGVIVTYRNLMLTMVLGGLWHGAAWNFVLWGAYHGGLLCVHKAMGETPSATVHKKKYISHVIKTLLFFVLTCYGWLLFNSPSLERVVTLSSTLLFDFGKFDFGAMRPRAAALFGLPVFLCIELIENAANGKSFYTKLPVPVWTLIYAAMIFTFAIGINTEPSQFIYFKF